MQPSSNYHLVAVFVALGIFVGMLTALEIGRRIGIRRQAQYGENARIGIGVVDGAVYAVLSLLIGFTFSGAAGRFDHRREIIARVTNQIGSAWDMVDALPAESQPPVREGLRHYVDALLTSYQNEAPTPELHEPPAMASARSDIWSRSMAAVLREQPSGEKARMLLLPALNDMFSVIEEERLARRIHAPLIVYAMLGVAALAAGLFAGYGVANKDVHNRLLTVGVAATIAMAVYVIVELEYPRLGAVRITDMDSALVDLRASMK